MTTQVETTGN